MDLRLPAREDSLKAAERAAILKFLRGNRPPPHHRVGLGAHFGASSGTVTLFHAALPVALKDGPLVPDARDRVTLRGTAMQPAHGVRALVNRGASGVAECSDNHASLPEIEVVCTLQRSDARAWIELTLDDGHLFPTAAVSVLAERSPGEPWVYREREAYREAEAGFDRALWQGINARRVRLGLRKLDAVAGPTRVARTVARDLFLASFRGDRAEMDALGQDLLDSIESAADRGRARVLASRRPTAAGPACSR
jgi:hypothetical protein